MEVDDASAAAMVMQPEAPTLQRQLTSQQAANAIAGPVAAAAGVRGRSTTRSTYALAAAAGCPLP
jgi:hypothetical protein